MTAAAAGDTVRVGAGTYQEVVVIDIVTGFTIENANFEGVFITNASDATGPTHDNLISGNVVRDNPDDCGITLASHKPVAPNGVYHNTIASNLSSRNGLATGEGAGVGLFTPAPGTATYGNVVVGNRLTDNGLPGVAMHSHAPGQNLNDNAQVFRHRGTEA